MHRPLDQRPATDEQAIDEPEIRLAAYYEEIAACFPVMHELRPHLDPLTFVDRVLLQQKEGYQLLFLRAEGAVRAVAGFRLVHNLYSGRELYVDDLSTAAAYRSRQYGSRLMDWLVSHARSLQCDTIELDSGVQRFDAHRFYLRHRFHIVSHHFRLFSDEAGARERRGVV